MGAGFDSQAADAAVEHSPGLADRTARLFAEHHIAVTVVTGNGRVPAG